MKRVVRNSVFETNSSSVHSLTICNSGNEQRLNISYDNTIICGFGEFGWEETVYYDAESRLSYLLTMIQYKDREEYLENGVFFKTYENYTEEMFVNSIYYKWIQELIEEKTSAKLKVIFLNNGWSPLGYIDHQSIDTLDEIWSDDEKQFKTNMTDFIFNSRYILETGNDNG